MANKPAEGRIVHPRFAILIPAFHTEQWIARCLRSAMEQYYSDFRIFFVDDYSADGTGTIGRETLRESKVLVKHWINSERRGILANQWAMLAKCDGDEIAVCLDGDDQLAHPHVLSRLAQEYADPATWVTYGSYEYDKESRNSNGDCRGISQPIPPTLHNRHAGWRSSHLKTFRVALARHIQTEDLKFGGEWIDAAPDLALMFPLIEMAGPQHARFIPEILYYYNDRNLLSESRIKPAWVRVMTREIMSRPVYPLLEQL